jgi:NAD(P)-dependent dehydrogenase (short-subunit alcohol dehydrogenase family)
MNGLGGNALVTGGSRGIGRACALSLAGRGVNVALTYVENSRAAEATAEEIRAHGRRAVVLQADAASAEANAAAVAAAVEQLRDRPFVVEAPAGLDAGTTRRIEAAQAEASVDSFRFGVGIAAVLVALGGALGLVGIRNPRREVAAEGCAGGQFVGAPQDASRQSPCDWHNHSELPVVTVPVRQTAS